MTESPHSKCARCKLWKPAAPGQSVCGDCMNELAVMYQQIDNVVERAKANAYKRWLNYPPIEP